MSDGSERVAPEIALDELPELIGGVWQKVLQQVNKLIETHDRFGFVQFKSELNPSLEEILLRFEFVDFALTKLLESKILEYDETRNALNSKQCILKMKELSAVLNSGHGDEYERVMNELRAQSKF